MKRYVVGALVAVFAPGAMAEEPDQMPAYTIVSKAGAAEVRSYAPMIVAEVTVEGASLGDAASNGFRPLANYIFGGNTPRQKIAMTSPVMAAPEAQQIAMTSPVTAAPAGPAGGYVVRFIMPPEWTLETLPAPSNPDVRLAALPGRLVAALRYTGRDTAQARSKAETALRSFVTAEGYAASGAAEWAGYDSPMVPFWMRRYEIMLPVTPANKE